MAYDERLAERVRRLLARRGGIEERRMFGGLTFLKDGRMFCGVLGDELLARVGPDAHAEALARPHARPMAYGGKTFVGYVHVGAGGVRDDRALEAWVRESLEFVATLAAAPAGGRRRR